MGVGGSRQWGPQLAARQQRITRISGRDRRLYKHALATCALERPPTIAAWEGSAWGEKKPSGAGEREGGWLGGGGAGLRPAMHTAGQEAASVPAAPRLAWHGIKRPV